MRLCDGRGLSGPVFPNPVIEQMTGAECRRRSSPKSMPRTRFGSLRQVMRRMLLPWVSPSASRWTVVPNSAISYSGGDVDPCLPAGEGLQSSAGACGEPTRFGLAEQAAVVTQQRGSRHEQVVGGDRDGFEGGDVAVDREPTVRGEPLQAGGSRGPDAQQFFEYTF